MSLSFAACHAQGARALATTHRAAKGPSGASRAPAVAVVSRAGEVQQEEGPAQAQAQALPSFVPSAPVCGRRAASIGAGVGALSLLLGLVPAPRALGALLEEDDDVELLERVKSVRKERLNSKDALKPQGEALQSAVTDLRAVAKALDSGDLPSAAKAAALVADAAEKLAAGAASGAFLSGLKDLQAALSAEDLMSAKKAFVASATNLQELSAASGFAIKGL